MSFRIKLKARRYWLNKEKEAHENGILIKNKPIKCYECNSILKINKWVQRIYNLLGWKRYYVQCPNCFTYYSFINNTRDNADPFVKKLNEIKPTKKIYKNC